MIAAGVILAAGQSRRMGTPKALLDYRGSTFLDTLVDLFLHHCANVTVVLGYHNSAIRAGSRALHRARSIENPDPQRGMLSSWQCGLASLDPCDAVLITPVDHPAVTEPTISALIAGISGHEFAIPRFGGRRGHPIAFNSAVIPQFLSLPASAAPRDVVHAHRARTNYIDVDDPAIIVDVDEPADYVALMRRA